MKSGAKQSPAAGGAGRTADAVLRLFDTRRGRKQAFAPRDPARATLYVCGPTVYGPIHIGNARPAVVFDLLARILRGLCPQLVYVRNITDIDDKIIAAAHSAGVRPEAVARKFANRYREDMQALGVAPPDVEPAATGHIPAMREMIEKLLAAGHAYEAEGHVLFHVPSFADYGALSHRRREDMVAGARVEVAPYKKDPADFVLWKPSPADLPGWESPWGRGRPGWHIECSAMIAAHLGAAVDIHGGGQDLIFPHHENERAQSICARAAGGPPGGGLAGIWMHNGMVNMGSEKMSKSQGNVIEVGALARNWPGEALRLALLTAHYRQPLDWTAETPAAAVSMLDRLYGALRGSGEAGAPDEAVRAALLDDLNTPKALARLFALAQEANRSEGREKAQAQAQLRASGALLGLLQDAAWFERGKDADRAGIEQLVARREEARAAGDFAEADRLRDQLEAMGVRLEDGTGGTRWRMHRRRQA